MTTRLSKIARLPATIREQLNRRLHNGELGRTILPWVNALPKTKKVLAELFNAKPITHQNLSEWRATGYQDWLFHQARLQWFSRVDEEDKEISKHDDCPDTYEAMSRFFIFEIGQAMQAAQKIKNPDARWKKIEPLAEKFARLQNSYNWSRRVQLEFDKYNHQFEPEDPEESELQSPEPPEGHEAAIENGDRARPGRSETRPRVSHLRFNSSIDLVPPHASDVRREAHRTAAEAAALPEKSDASSQPEDPAELPEPSAPCPDSSTPQLLNSQTPIPNCQPIPTLAPATPINPRIVEQTNPIRKSRTLYTRTRGRGFTCIEG